MRQEEIIKAFKNRWRIKSESVMATVYKAIVGQSDLQDLSFRIESLCRDFFEAGICLGEGYYEDEIPNPDAGLILKYDFIFDTADSGFSEWWELYNKKRGKEKCMKKWEKMSYEDRRACIEATPAYVASTEDKQFRKDPLTYLNGKCWNDEIIIRQNGNNKPTPEQRRIDKLADILTD